MGSGFCGPNSPLTPFSLPSSLPLPSITFSPPSSCHAQQNWGGDGSGLSVSNTDEDLREVSVERCRFINNAAVTHGGGLRAADARLTVVDSMFIGNEARTSGGAFYANLRSVVSVRGCTFEDNFSQMVLTPAAATNEHARERKKTWPLSSPYPPHAT